MLRVSSFEIEDFRSLNISYSFCRKEPARFCWMDILMAWIRRSSFQVGVYYGNWKFPHKAGLSN